MKTIGEQAKAFREARNWTVKEMAAACKTSRQNIETLEAKGARTPRYIKELARVMETTVDTLMEGRYRVGSAPIAQAPAAAPATAAAPVSGDDLQIALAVVAKAIGEADKMTRASVGPLFSLLADDPSLSGTIAQRVHKLLTDTVSDVLQEDNAASGRRRLFHAGKPVGEVLGQHDKRDSVQKKEAGGKR